jgi:hypothetical protein
MEGFHVFSTTCWVRLAKFRFFGKLKQGIRAERKKRSQSGAVPGVFHRLQGNTDD